jgi:hypothetical protein
VEYYSEVVVSMSPRLAAVFEALLDHESSMEDLCNCADIFETSSYGLLIRWARFRWYHGLPAIDNFTSFLTGFEESEFKYIRIGEDADDVEQYGSYCGLGVRLVQKIEIDEQ